MKFEKSPPWLVELFGDALAGTPGDRRQMFGYPCGFMNGQLFCGLFASSMFVHLGDAYASGMPPKKPAKKKPASANKRSKR